jgi:S-formylglutathione hydrolase FrmB
MNYKLKILACSTLFALYVNAVVAQKFAISYLSGSKDKFTGNIFLYLSKENKDPKDGNVGIESFPCYRIIVGNIKPGQPVLVDDAAVSYPVPLSDLERGEYYVQAVWDENSGGRGINNSPGNIYNKSLRVLLTKDRDQVFKVVCKEVVAEPDFIETEYTREIKTRSALLSAFYGRPTSINAAVILPKEYKDQPERKFPVLYFVFGYGGDYHVYSGSQEASEPVDTTPCIRVILDGNCPLGHSVYANSDNNGPWGDALTQELIPEIEKTYRCNTARLLTGHSSGGWTVLWLQTHYPELFAGCWSSSPDPVDFRNFQRIDLYTDKNMFYGRDSVLRMMATISGIIPWASMKMAYQMENVISRGEQMHSFDAVFSQRNSDGSPGRICDPKTGAIDPVTAEHWKNYDISLYLRMNWDQLKPKLYGKIRISIGHQDNFLLNYSVYLLEEEMKKLDTGFEFAYYPGDHFTVSTADNLLTGYRFLEKRYYDYMKK